MNLQKSRAERATVNGNEAATAAPGLTLPGMLALAAWFGLITGLGEGLIDLTLGHYHAPAIVCITLLADLGLFLALGALLCLAGRVARRGIGIPVAFFLYFWVLSYCWWQDPLAGSPLLTIFFGGVAAALLALFVRRHRRGAWRVAAGSLPWIAAAAAVCLIAIPLAGFWSEREAIAALPASAPGAPNVVLVILDTVRADHLSVYGYGRATSPNLDRLGREGALFETAIAPSSWTLPSHASIMTGIYPHSHHVVHAGNELSSGFPTLAWALRQAGYRTAGFSANSLFFSRRTGLAQGFLRFGDFFLTPGDALAQVHWVEGVNAAAIHLGWAEDLFGRQTAAAINRAALAWVGRRGGPFFLALNYLDAHDPYVPPQPWRHRFSQQLTPGGRINIDENILPRLTPPEIHDEMDAYDGAIAYEDDQVGRLLEALDRRGLLANTLVVVASDHGEAFGEHGLLDHANALYFPLVHVPLIFYWPGHVPAGARVARPVSTKDIGATILALLRRPPGELPGESLAALWVPRNNPPAWPLPISELAAMGHFMPQFPNYYGPLETIVGPTAQYIIDPRLGPLLYDWKGDPGEVHNLIDDPRYQPLAAGLGSELKAAESEQGLPSVARAGLLANHP